MVGPGRWFTQVTGQSGCHVNFLPYNGWFLYNLWARLQENTLPPIADLHKWSIDGNVSENDRGPTQVVVRGDRHSCVGPEKGRFNSH